MVSDFFSKNFIQINGRYINKNHIVLVKEDPEDGEVYIALSNKEQLYMDGTLDQLREKMGAYDTFEEEEKYILEKLYAPGRVTPSEDNPNVVSCEYDPLNDRTIIVRRKKNG